MHYHAHHRWAIVSFGNRYAPNEMGFHHGIRWYRRPRMFAFRIGCWYLLVTFQRAHNEEEQ